MLTGVVAHGMMILALSMAPASVLQPFNYTSLPWAILLSVVLFHEPIDAISLLGAAVIVGAGLVVMARERIRKVPAGPPNQRCQEKNERDDEDERAERGDREQQHGRDQRVEAGEDVLDEQRRERCRCASSTSARRSSTFAQTVSGRSILPPRS